MWFCGGPAHNQQRRCRHGIEIMKQKTNWFSTSVQTKIINRAGTADAFAKCSKLGKFPGPTLGPILVPNSETWHPNKCPKTDVDKYGIKMPKGSQNDATINTKSMISQLGGFAEITILLLSNDCF